MSVLTDPYNTWSQISVKFKVIVKQQKGIQYSDILKYILTKHEIIDIFIFSN